ANILLENLPEQHPFKKQPILAIAKEPLAGIIHKSNISHIGMWNRILHRINASEAPVNPPYTESPTNSSLKTEIFS
ncbi:MAG: hypothetical protein WC554_12440, partial [Clostridia bacterium]